MHRGRHFDVLDLESSLRLHDRGSHPSRRIGASRSFRITKIKRKKNRKKNLLWSVHGAMIIIIIIIIEITMLRYMIKMII